MSDIALRVSGLSKRYRLGLQENSSGGMYRYKSLRDSFGGFTKRPLQTLKSSVVQEPMNEDNSFWALKDINFEVKKGEIVGIIGRNGAGKSTLLKILSQITKPTTGKVDLYGRVGSLLEVGTGFHPELSGRENIYLNGAILGMSKAEVTAKFDEIVTFSEVEKFLDMAVKQYSSGMYMRLAFAVAAHLEPEILVVDEVLSVGDALFQRKCLGKMKDVAGEGRTVLFVSHNLGQISTLCNSAIMLERGNIAVTGLSRMVIDKYAYLGTFAESSTVRQKCITVTIKCGRENTSTISQFLFTESIAITTRIESTSEMRQAAVWIIISRSTGETVSSICNFEEGLGALSISPSSAINVVIPAARLNPGRYNLTAKIFDEITGDRVFFAEEAWSFEVLPAPVKAGARPYLEQHGSARLIDSLECITR